MGALSRGDRSGRGGGGTRGGRRLGWVTAAAVAGLVLAVSWLTAAVAARAVRASLERRAVDSCSSWLPGVARERRQVLRRWLDQGIRDAAAVALHPDTVRLAAGRGGAGRLRELLRATAAAHGFVGIRVVAADGRILADSGGGGRFPAPGRRPAGLVRAPGGGFLVAFRSPVPGPRRVTVEVLGHTARELAALLAPPVGAPLHVETFVVFHDGEKLMALSSAGRVAEAAPVLRRAAAEAAGRRGAPLFRAALLAGGERWFVAAVPVPRTAWVLVSAVGRSRVLAGVAARAAWVGRMAGASLAALLFLALGTWRHWQSLRARDAARSEARYREIFEAAPVTLVEGEMARVMEALDGLEHRGIGDLERYLAEHPEELRRLAGWIRIVSANSGAVRLYGLRSPRQLLGPLDLSVIAQAEDGLAAWLASVARGDPVFEREVRILPPAGGERHALIRIRSRRAPDERGRFVASVVDITAQRCAERARTEAEGVYRTLFNAAADAIFIPDLDGRLLEVNEVACERLGYSRDELIGMTPLEFIPPELADRLRVRLATIRETGRLSFESVHVTRDGRRIPVEINSRVFEYRGRPAVMSVARDIGERAAALKRITFLNRLLETRSEVSRVIVSARDRRELLKGVCSVLKHEGGFSLAWVVTAAGPQGMLRMEAASDAGNRFAAAIRRLLIQGAEGGTPRFEAVRMGSREVIQDLMGETGGALGLHQVAVEHGYRSLAAVPIPGREGATGSLAVVSVEPHVFTDKVVALLEELAADVGFALRALEVRRELVRSEERYRLLADKARDIVFSLRLERPAGFEYISPSVKAVTGYSAEELAADPRLPYRVVHPDDRPRLTAVLRGAVPPSGRPTLLRWRHRDGHIVWTEQVTSAVTDASGRVIAIHGIARDVTERVLAEQRLRRSERRYRRLFERNLAGVYRTTVDGRLLDCNDAFARIFGFASREEVLGRRAWDLYGDPAVRRRFLDTLRREGSLAGYEQPMRRRDGSPLWVMLSATLVGGEEEDGGVIEGTLMDLTDRRRIEEALEAAARRLEEAERIAEIGSWEWDPGAGTVLVSRELCRILGLGDPGDEGRYRRYPEGRIAGLIHPEDRERILAAERALLESGEPYDEEYRIVRPDGEVRWVHDRAEVYRLRRGGDRLVRGTVQDVTERRLLEDQLRQAQKMEAIGRLAGGVAHDFNNILQAVMVINDGLRLAAGDADGTRAAAEDIAQQLERAAALTRQLLLFSRRETMKPELVDLNEVTSSMAKMLGRLVREDIQFSVLLGEEQIPVMADRGQVEQVLMNLVVNAVDAMPAGGSLVVRTGSRGGERPWTCLEVVDTGRGIPDDIRERIFEPFFTTKEAGRGTGLGLSVVHGIVTAHGGRIEVESRVGVGTTFRILLPVATGHAKSPSDGYPVLPPEGGGERILVVEDNPAVRESLQESLAGLGYRVTAVGSGEEAEALGGEAPGLLLTDQVLPGMSGLELAGRLRSRWPGLAVVLMSGYSEDEALKDMVGSGRIRFLQKPAALARIAAEVRAALDEAAGQ